jgi:TonB family protein
MATFRLLVGGALVLFIFAGTLTARESTPLGPAIRQAAAPTIPSYPDTTRGLEKLIKDMVKLAQAGDSRALQPYLQSLDLPNAEDWYKSVFGDDFGKQLTAASQQVRATVQADAQSTLSTVLKEHLTDVHAVKFEDSCNEQATAREYPMLTWREGRQPFFDVRFSGAGNHYSVWGFFVYVDGGFRYIGELYRKLPPGYVKPRPGEQLKNVIKVAGNVQAAKLIHQEYPSYPLAQKAQHQEGTVVLHATIAKDGSVQNLAVVEGTCAFSRSALEAVKGWRYTPTLLNGEPVEVDTTISVIFTLSRK